MLCGMERERHDGWRHLGRIVASFVKELESARCRRLSDEHRASGRGFGETAPVGENIYGASVSPDARGHGGHDEQAGIR